MRIKLSQEVFKLIKSFSPSEKAYFKKLASGKSSSKLVRAFDIINSAKEFDEDTIKARMEGAGIPAGDTFKRLVPVLLKSMNQYHASNNAAIQLNQMAISVELLNQRNLVQLCRNQVEKAIELAEQTRQGVFIHHFRNWKAKLRMVQSEKNYEVDEENHTRSLQALEEIRINSVYQHLYRKLSIFMNRQDTSVQTRSQLVREILENPLIQKEPHFMAVDFTLRNSILSATYYYLGYWQEAIKIMHTQLLDKPLDSAELSAQQLLVYIHQLANLAGLYQLVYDSQSYCEIEKKIKEILQAHGSRIAETFRSVINEHLVSQKQLHLGYSGNLDAALKMIKQNNLEKKLAGGKASGNQLSIAFVYFLSENYREAAQQINLIKGDESLRQVMQLQKVADWLELICFYLVQDISLFEARFRAQNRRVKATANHYKWERLFLKGLKDSYLMSAAQRKNYMKKLLTDMLPFEKEIRTEIRGLDINLWIESQAKAKPMRVLLKERYLAGR